MRGTNLSNAELEGANLRGVEDLTQSDIKWAVSSYETELPEGLNRPELWSKGLKEQVTPVLDD